MMYEIVPHLFLSSFRDADPSSDFFVINCTRDLPMIQTHGGGTRLLVDDDPVNYSDKMTQNLPLMVRYIHDHVSRGHNVLVHCYAGQQRSAAVVAAYLIQYENMSVDEAVSYLKTKKPDAFAGGVHFMESLKSFYANVHK